MTVPEPYHRRYGIAVLGREEWERRVRVARRRRQTADQLRDQQRRLVLLREQGVGPVDVAGMDDRAIALGFLAVRRGTLDMCAYLHGALRETA